MKCGQCASEVPEGKRFCADCGTPASDASEEGTRTSLLTSDQVSSTPSSSPTLDGARFLPGVVLAERYRIISLLGRGGMGEVYRADDLKLGQPVALKFLPAELAGDERRLGRLLGEVKVARQVSHPAVCRVYDIAETDGQHFISMEYVDGDNLATLLKQIDHMPGDKAIQIARQLCAGLAAAHDQSIVHRDLKPANVMLDKSGRVRITDFGLATLAEGIEGAEILAGTPTYMAPETLAGKEVTLKSDIYALGLVLYELFTGKPPFTADSVAELARLQQDTTPTSLSSHLENIDPAVERVVLRCLEKDPRLRPPSALAVAAALPGGDPLAAALAAGETPSPDMVADAGDVGGVAPGIGAAALGLALVGLVAVGLIAPATHLAGRDKLDKSAEVLASEARGIARKLGYDREPRDTAYAFTQDRWGYMSHIEENDTSADRWDVLAQGWPSRFRFWYRESPRLLMPQIQLGEPPAVRVGPRDPPRDISGMVSLELDPEGRLREFEAVPPQRDESPDDTGDPDWSALFTAAGLDPAHFDSTEPHWLPPRHADVRAAWVGSYPGRPDTEIRIEAAAYRGRAVYFGIIDAWSEPWRMQEDSPTGRERLSTIVGATMGITVMLGVVLLARHNLRMGRGDRKGAFRIAIYVALISLVGRFYSASHLPVLNNEFNLFFNSMVLGIVYGCFVWFLYIALEPYARRLWPEMLISWNRVLSGRFRDPRLGRDILIGAVAGIASRLFMLIHVFVPGWTGSPPHVPFAIHADAFLGLRHLPTFLLADWMVDPILRAMAMLALLLLLRVVLRFQKLAVAMLFVLPVFAGGIDFDHFWVDTTLNVIQTALALFIMLRFGLFALAAFVLFRNVSGMIETLDPSQLYAGASYFALIVASVVVAYGFYISLGGRSIFKDSLLQD